jgi:hypothetical protein
MQKEHQHGQPFTQARASGLVDLLSRVTLSGLILQSAQRAERKKFLMLSWKA